MKRYVFIDLLRGIAVLSMIVFHFLFVMKFVGELEINLYGGWMLVFVRIVQFLFLGLVGFSLALSKRGKSGNFWGKQGSRLVNIGLAAAIVSMGTYLAVGDLYVRFGVLHFIFVASILIFPLVGKRWVLFGVVVLGVLGRILTYSVPFDFPVLAYVLGFRSVIVETIDYFSLIPWISFVALGALLEDIVFPYFDGIEKRFDAVFFGKVRKVLKFLGSNSLMAYLLQAPLILLIVLLYFWGKDVLM